MRKSLIALTALGLSTGIFGCSKGVEDIYTFKYHGQEAVIQKNNVLMLPDRNWIKIGNDKIKDGIITSDDNKIITINNQNIFDKYSIKDKN